MVSLFRRRRVPLGSRLIAIPFLVIGSAALIGSVVALLFVPDQMAVIAVNPGGVYRTGALCVVLAFLAAFFFVTAHRVMHPRRLALRRVGWVAAAVAAMLGLVLIAAGWGGPVDRPWLMGLGAVCLVGVIAFIVTRRRTPVFD